LKSTLLYKLSVSLLVAFFLGALLLGSQLPAAEEAAAPAAVGTEIPLQPIPEIAYDQQIGSFLKKNCIDCHGADLQEGGLRLDQFDSIESMRKQRKTWKHLAQLVEIEAMPPVESDPMPTTEERQQFAQLVDLALNYVDCDQIPDPGRVTIRRLSRNEYNNTIRDLMYLDITPADRFPTDDVGEGFDNIGDVLTLSPILFEKYFTAAELIAGEAIWDKKANQPQTKSYTHRSFKPFGSAKYVRDGIYAWSMPSAGGLRVEFESYQTEEFRVELKASADQAGPELAKARFSIDGEEKHIVEIKENRKTRNHKFKVEIPEGKHTLEIAFINDYYNPDSDDPKLKGDRNLWVHAMSLKGTQPLAFKKMPKSHREILFCQPDENHSVHECAKRILEKFTTRAFRRPVRTQELEGLVKLVEQTMEAGDSFPQAIRHALTAVLVSPHFLFRVEINREPENPNVSHRIDDYELASRLSYFLWSSMPDEELLTLASKDQLHYQPVLESQVRRMLQDEKADALVENFAGQWLNLRNLEEISPAPEFFKQTKIKEKWFAQWREYMQGETEMLFAHIMREDKNLFELLDADYTFINEPLAKLYGIPDIKGAEYQKVSLEKLPRRGLLTHASILTLTSNPTRTAPVKRGKWVMENILGVEPPPPPPNVPPLEDLVDVPDHASVRERLEMHRADPGCASCHKQLDPLGLGFENFNAIGVFRKTENKVDIDASGIMPNGEKFNGSLELIKILRNQEEEFQEILARKMLTYALGRGLDVYDQCAIEEIKTELNNKENRFSALVMGIVNSEPFLKRRGEGAR